MVRSGRNSTGQINMKKIFILSGLYAEDLEKEALDNGATGFLSKSLGIEAIVKAVCDVLVCL